MTPSHARMRKAQANAETVGKLRGFKAKVVPDPRHSGHWTVECTRSGEHPALMPSFGAFSRLEASLDGMARLASVILGEQRRQSEAEEAVIKEKLADFLNDELLGEVRRRLKVEKFTRKQLAAFAADVLEGDEEDIVSLVKDVNDDELLVSDQFCEDLRQEGRDEERIALEPIVRRITESLYGDEQAAIEVRHWLQDAFNVTHPTQCISL